MDAVHSGTGVFYQAMPAVGADGKNIMKLIPVQMVNGRFIPTQMSMTQTNSAAQKAVTMNNTSGSVLVAEKEAGSHCTTERFVRNHFSLVNNLPNKVNFVLSNSLNKPPMQKQTSNLTTKVSQMADPSTILGKLIRLPRELPVTVKSPALPRGQYLQIPPNAQVQRVPASELPPAIKEQIFTSSANSSAYSSSPSVVLVSPVTTMRQGVPEPSGSTTRAVKLLPKTPNPTACVPLKGVQPQLRLIPKVSQRPNSPTRWVIEEVDNSSPDNLRPVDSPSSPSEILRSVTEGGNAVRQTISQTIHGKDVQGQENALVVCNGKVFFVGKNGSLTSKSTAARESSEGNKVVFPSPRQQSAAPQTNPELRTLDKSNEVIDLCDDDDDAQEDQLQQASQLDEDNVIFVSYIPPKAESSTAKEVILKTTMGPGEKTTLMTSSGSNRRADVSVGGQSIPIRQDDHANGKSQRSISTQQRDHLEVGATTGSPADPEDRGERAEASAPEPEASAPEPVASAPEPQMLLLSEPCQMSDRLLRNIFGITADVRICLQKIDEAGPGCFSADLLHTESMRLAEDDEEASGLKEKELSFHDIWTDISHDPVNVPSVKVQTEHKVSTSPHASVTPLKSSPSKLNTKHPSRLKENCWSLGQSSLSKTRCSESEPVVSYVEPIDEDFPDENDNPRSQDGPAHPQTQTCRDINASTRRVGRTRKRTMCPCCVPYVLHPVGKSSARFEEPEECTLTADQTSKKAGRPKVPRKDGRTSSRISCVESRSKNSKPHEIQSGDGLEFKRHEQSERLEDILEEKVAQIRKGMS
ncbi:ligand-dependent nuclear receptor-interacting factor 1 [Cololabis saira]|uniref:ligand-dependent nuclear receptor-interacting factor 1 n=1 Tax=Cololabis saira TaxID=129043 RepID=UPI002AD35A51|nr:ligand-dependent nuclear receptor-interacting factor 1 [Cololabis saira]